MLPLTALYDAPIRGPPAQPASFHAVNRTEKETISTSYLKPSTRSSIYCRRPTEIYSSLGCGAALQDAAQLRGCGAAHRMRCSSLGCGAAQRMRRSSLGCGAAQGCGVAQLVVRRLAVRQARVRISARHPMETPLAERRRDEDSRRRGGEW
jgi:hypothetical protein